MLQRSLQLARAKAELSQEALNEAETTIDLLTEALTNAESRLQYYDNKPQKNKDGRSGPSQRRTEIDIAMSLRELCRSIEIMSGQSDEESFDGRRSSLDPDQHQVLLPERALAAEQLLKTYKINTAEHIQDLNNDVRDMQDEILATRPSLLSNTPPKNKDGRGGASQKQKRTEIDIATRLRELCRSIENMSGQESLDGRSSSLDPKQTPVLLPERALAAEQLLQTYRRQTKLALTDAASRANKAWQAAKEAKEVATDIAASVSASNPTPNHLHLDNNNSTSSSATARQLKRAKKKIQELKNDVIDMQDEIVALNASQTATNAKEAATNSAASVSVSNPILSTSSSATAKQLIRAHKKIQDLKNDVIDMQDEILATHRAQNESSLLLTTALKETEHQKGILAETQQILQSRTALLLPLIFSVRHVINQYRSIKQSEPTVHDILKNIRNNTFDNLNEDEYNDNTATNQRGDGFDIRQVTALAESSTAGSMMSVFPTENEIDDLCTGLSELLKMNNNSEESSRNNGGDESLKVAQQMLMQAKLQRQSAALREENLHDEIERLEHGNQTLRDQLDDMKDQMAVMNLNHKLLQVGTNGGGYGHGLGSGISSPLPHHTRERWHEEQEEAMSLAEEMQELRLQCEKAAKRCVQDQSDEDDDSDDDEDTSEEDEDEDDDVSVLQAPAMLGSERFLR